MASLRPLLLVSALAGAASAQQQLLLPFNHHLSNSVGHVAGSPNIFRSTAARNQILYEAPNFLAAGVTGPITIQKLRFRAEDTEANHGGQVYSNVTVQIGSTSISSQAPSSFSSTWTNNWFPPSPHTTTAGPLVTIPTLTLAPSLGTAPNNYYIEIDLAALGGSITFDPTGTEPNLLIEIITPTAPTFTIGTALAYIGTAYAIGTSAQIFGACYSSSNPTGTTGVAINAPIINVEFAGAGGYPALIPARVDPYGFGCGGQPSSFYQFWAHNQAFDLANSTLVLTPDNPVAPNFYIVTSGGPAPDVTKVNVAPNSIADDLSVPLPLGFNFNYPGGTTQQLEVSCNGYFFVSPHADATSWVVTLDKWLGVTGAPPRFAAFWHDFHCGRNTVSHPNSGLHVLTDTSGGPGNTVAYMTWLNVGRANTSSQNGGHHVDTFQIAVFEASGTVEYRYGSMGPIEGANTGGLVTGMTGFTRGNILGVPSVDPQSRDLSTEVPFTTFPEGPTGHMGLQAVQAATIPSGLPGRFFQGQAVTWNVTNVPAGTILGSLWYDFVGLAPGLQLPGIIAPGCTYSLGLNPQLIEYHVLPGPTVTGTTPLVAPSGYQPTILGAQVHVQYLLLDGLFGGPDLFTGASNALRHTVGLQ